MFCSFSTIERQCCYLLQQSAINDKQQNKSKIMTVCLPFQTQHNLPTDQWRPQLGKQIKPLSSVSLSMKVSPWLPLSNQRERKHRNKLNNSSTREIETVPSALSIAHSQQIVKVRRSFGRCCRLSELQMSSAAG